MKPCPFCRSDKILRVIFKDQYGDYKVHIHCENCKATGPWAGNAEKAEDLWNKMEIA
jgi:Lar family restriction alleviation protein